MKRLKLTAILSLAIVPGLVWPLALSEASTPMVKHYGVAGCVAFAVLIAVISAYLFVRFSEEV